MLSGAWLGILSPFALLPALPTLASNSLSGSPWMAAGKAHYSGLVLPFVALGAAAGLARLRSVPHGVPIASALLVLGSVVAYLGAGAGPLGANYAPAVVTEHALRADRIVQSLPADAAVSASSTLVPHLSHRARLYLFPAVLDADYVALDLRATAAPTSPGDVFLQVRDLLGGGSWAVDTFDDGLLVLRRDDAAPPVDVLDLPGDWLHEPASAAAGPRRAATDQRRAGAGSRGRARRRRPARHAAHGLARERAAAGRRTGLDFLLDLRGPEQVRIWDVPALWWYPPDRWPVGQPVAIDISNVPRDRFLSWQGVRTSR